MENTEPYRMPRRSQSHGSLRSNYSRNARPMHKPLSRVNENSALLPTSGALGGMLKTTTETGDIGLYSINPVPNNTAFGPPYASRGPAGRRYLPQFPSPPHLHPPCSSIDGHGRHDYHQRMRPKSSRDTTSEIISMYGSTSQSSVTSTRATSTEEQGQRSHSMTTVGSRHLSHNKSNATLQSQASSGPLQRPRSPFPYPTRLKRPGARPVSPVVTEAGIVDYSRMVEIDRISLRTGYGPLKSSYPHAHRRPPLGLRPDANPSTPSLHSRGPPQMRRPAGPASVRTASAATIASWAASNSEPPKRVDSYSSRTSSLTSVVNMYYRMPPALKAAQFGTLAPPPRYYDYTEEFENRRAAVEPSQPAIERVASVTTRAPTAIQRPLPLVLREGSEEELAHMFGNQVDSVFDEDEGRLDESDSETEPHLLSDVQPEDLNPQIPSDPQAQSASNLTHTGKKDPMPIHRSTIGSQMSRGSDIDLLPSQIGRSSVDTFRPSLDIESKSAQIFSYPKLRQSVSQQTNTPSPARQVQVHGGKTPTIKSEQGVILRDDPIRDFLEHRDVQHDFRQEDIKFSVEDGGAQAHSPRSPSRWISRSDRAQRQLDLSCDHVGDVATPKRRFATTEPVMLDYLQSVTNTAKEMSPDKPAHNYSPSAGPKASVPTSEPFGNFKNVLNDTAQHEEHFEPQPRPRETSEETTVSTDTIQRRQPNLRLDLRMASPEGAPSTPQLTPSCLSAPLKAPKPLSPVRELRVKNSIPELMKALPPTPCGSGYVSSSPSINLDDEDEYTQILTPYVSLDDRDAVRKSRLSFSLRKPLPDLQKKLPRIRIKSKGPGSMAGHRNRDSRPWNSDNNYPWCNDSPSIKLGGDPAKENNRGSFGQRLKLGVPRDVRAGSPASTVRRYPGAHRSEPLGQMIREQPQDLFSFSNALGSAFRQASRKISQGPTDKATFSKHRGVSSPLPKKRHGQIMIVTPSVDLSNPTWRADRSPTTRSRALDGGLNINQRRGLRKRLSNLKWFLSHGADDKASGQATEETEVLHSKNQAGLDSTIGLRSPEFKNDNPVSGLTFVDTQEDKPRFKRRVRAKLSKWVRGTRAVFGHTRRNARAGPVSRPIPSINVSLNRWPGMLD